MKTFIVFIVLIAIAQAAPVADDVVPIVRSDVDYQPDGSYVFSFETGDGMFREEKGTAVNPGKEDGYVAVVGSYKYLDAEGKAIEVHYTADEHGFVPTGEHIHPSIVSAAKAVAV